MDTIDLADIVIYFAAMDAAFNGTSQKAAMEVFAKGASFDQASCVVAGVAPDGVAHERLHVISYNRPSEDHALVSTGRLLQSLIDGADHKRDVTETSATVGSVLEYALTQHNGGAGSTWARAPGDPVGTKRYFWSGQVTPRPWVHIAQASIDSGVAAVGDGYANSLRKS